MAYSKSKGKGESSKKKDKGSKKPKKRATLLALSVSIVASFGFGRSAPNQPGWEGRLYQGWPKLEAIVRMQAGEVISCRDDEFKNYICMSTDDYLAWVDTYINGCKKW